MNKLKNTQKIQHITMYPDAYTRCEIGGDFYKNSMEIEFSPDKTYPDYTEFQDWIMENVDGRVMNIEDVVNEIYVFLQGTYSPAFLKIKNRITNCRTHFDVTVEK